jgi:2,5-diketo-D-gluconate reductase A
MSEVVGPEDNRIVLGDGNRIPVLGLGVWQIPDGKRCVASVSWALEAGYRHIDTAQAYRNEPSVGEAVRRSGIPRHEIFITTKFLPTLNDPVDAVKRSLERLGVDYVDLYLVHWPGNGPNWAWPGMERAQSLGYARSIGVSNFGAAELRLVAEQATVRPVVNQVQLSPFSYRRALLQEGAGLGVHFEAYSPLGTGRHLKDRTVKDMARRVGRSPAQVLLRWSVQRGFVVLPKSTHKNRIEENAALFDFELSEAEMAELDALDRTGGTADAQERRWW